MNLIVFCRIFVSVNKSLNINKTGSVRTAFLVRSCNHFCSGKAVLHILSVRLYL
jgi:hypothetical protein